MSDTTGKTPVTDTPRSDVEHAQRDATSELRGALERANDSTREREAAREQTRTRAWDRIANE